jgi:hypothetical protein
VWRGYSADLILEPNSSSRASNRGKVNWKFEDDREVVAVVWVVLEGRIPAPRTGNREACFSMLGVCAYLGLFAVAFGAATLLPFQSEPLLLGLLLSGEFSTHGLVAGASVGNVLGAVCNWIVGLHRPLHDRPWFPVKPSALDRASAGMRRWASRSPKKSGVRDISSMSAKHAFHLMLQTCTSCHAKFRLRAE